MNNILNKIKLSDQFILETACKEERLKLLFEFSGKSLQFCKEKLSIIFNQINEIIFLRNTQQAIVFSTKEKIFKALNFDEVVRVSILNDRNLFDFLLESDCWVN